MSICWPANQTQTWFIARSTTVSSSVVQNVVFIHEQFKCLVVGRSHQSSFTDVSYTVTCYVACLIATCRHNEWRICASCWYGVNMCVCVYFPGIPENYQDFHRSNLDDISDLDLELASVEMDVFGAIEEVPSSILVNQDNKVSPHKHISHSVNRTGLFGEKAKFNDRWFHFILYMF